MRIHPNQLKDVYNVSCMFNLKVLQAHFLLKLLFIGEHSKCPRNMNNTELAIHALDQVHCWGAYFHLGIGHYENFTS
jgi:hypothetical protein